MSEQCQRTIGGDGVPRRRCRKPARYVFSGTVAPSVAPLRRAYCVLHSGPGLLSEGALPGWVDNVIDLKESKR